MLSLTHTATAALVLLAVCSIQAQSAVVVPQCSSPPTEVVLSNDQSTFILSPSYPETYPDNAQCGWQIRSEDPNNLLFVECTKFRLQGKANGRCPDSLSINGNEFCGRRNPSYADAGLDIEFKSNGRRGSRGFNCTVAVINSVGRAGSPECLPTAVPLSVSPGERVFFNSPNYPGEYPATDCGWSFVPATADMQLTVSCGDFLLPDRNKKNGCSDSFTIPGSGKFCGTESPSVTVANDNLAVKFKANRRNNLSGFNCSITGELLPRTEAPAPLISTAAPTIRPPTNTNPCGLKYDFGTRIVGGITAGENEYPWQAGLVQKGTSNVFCGGSILSSRWILTAAHCAENIVGREANYQVLLGAHDLLSPSATETRHNIMKTIVYPKYNDETVDNDIALLEIDPVTLNSKVMPVCLPNPNLNYVGVAGTVTGWGTLSSGGATSDVLMEVTVPTLEDSKCVNAYNEFFTSNMFCAGLEAGGKDSCQGDSGGPMVTVRRDGSGQFEQIGIVSWGIGCAEAGKPGVYTQVKNYVDWIHENTDV